MRGVGGPLLCIGDLLRDVGDDGDSGDSIPEVPPPSFLPPTAASQQPLMPSDLHRLFEENYDQLTLALEGTDHSWTALTLKLCSAIKTADKLVSAADSNISTLLEKVEVLDSIIKQGDSAVATVKSVMEQLSTSDLHGQKVRPQIGNK